jgi:NADPH:quinone reductase-like Zn-dependent oxidoreductase
MDAVSSISAPIRRGARRKTSDAGLIVAQKKGGAVSLEVAAKIKKLIEIEKGSADLMVCCADVSNEKEMCCVCDLVRDRFGRVDGIIHTAGVLGQGMMHARSVEDIEKVFAPKVKGAILLDVLTREMKPDFMVLCSSMSSITPILGQVDYSAANAFLDAFAVQRTKSGGGLTVSVDWGFWQELGMISQSRMSDAEKRRIEEEIGQQGWAGAGVDVFSRILDQCSAAQVVVSTDGMAAGREASAVAPKQDTVHRRTGHPLFTECLVEPSGVESYVSRLSAAKYWLLDEHRVMDKVILPGTGYLELARAAFASHANSGAVEIRDLYFICPLLLEEGEVKEVRTILKPQGDICEFFVVSRTGPDLWQEHARGEITAVPMSAGRMVDLVALGARCVDEDIVIGQGGMASSFEQRISGFGPRWRNFRRAKFAKSEGLAYLALPEEFTGDLKDYRLHPALFDMATGFLSIQDGFESGLPFSYERVRLLGPLSGKVISHARRATQAPVGMLRYDVTVMNERGEVLVEVEAYTLRLAGETTQAYKHFAKPEIQTSAGAYENYSVEILSPGILDTLKFRPAFRRNPGQDEVEIEVEAAGLNFIEVLYAHGMLPHPPGGRVKFGLELAGTISRVGEGVKAFKEGDAVMAFAPAAFSRYAVTPATSVAHKPGHLSVFEAATVPAVFTTAYYSLVTLGRLARGEKVLIQAAAGGVGMAAVRIAQWIGAEIFATAGSEEKRAYLRTIGIRHVMDSRSTAFAAEIMAETEGRGVDVVLNSLGGDFIPAGLSVLGRYGRFLEIGKRDMFKHTQLDMAPFERHLSLFAIDVGPDMPNFTSIWREMAGHIAQRDFEPLPVKCFEAVQLAEAFAFMAKARHIGKIAISFKDQVSIGDRIEAGGGGLSLAAIIGTVGDPDFVENKSTVVDVKAKPVEPVSQGHVRPELPSEYVAPGSDTQKRVAGIWQELLGIEPIGLNDNFFDLKGDSLLAAQVVSRVHRYFRVKLPLSILFEAPTVGCDVPASGSDAGRAETGWCGDGNGRRRRGRAYMSPANELLARLQALGIKLWVEEDALRFRAPKGVMTETLSAEVRALKPELMALLDSSVRNLHPKRLRGIGLCIITRPAPDVDSGPVGRRLSGV